VLYLCCIASLLCCIFVVLYLCCIVFNICYCALLCRSWYFILNVVALYPDFSGMVFNATFNNISVISCRSMLLVDGTGVPGETHRPAACH
jgi:hypothetical protein